MEEFSEACTVLCQHTGTVLTGKEIRNMVNAMDQNKDGQIDFNEFLEAFRIVNHQHEASMMPKRRSSSCTNLSDSKLKKIAELPSKKH